MIIALTVGAYWLAGVLLDLYQERPFTQVRIPPDFGFTVGPLELPVGISLADPDKPARGKAVTVGPVVLKAGTVKFFVPWMQLALTVVVDVVASAVAILVFSIANPPKLGPTDAPPVYPKKGRQKSQSR